MAMPSYPCTLYDASAPLLSQTINPIASNFPQSGSWSWVNLIDSGLKGAISVLSRYSAGGVDQYTVIVGQLLCTKFRLNERAMNRLKETIANLKSMKTLGDMLHFGFGVDSIVRNLAATVEGGILIALSAAMIETFDSDHAATVFWELVKAFNPPDKQSPSPMQWKALIKACAGTLTETEFPQLAEHLMQLHSTNNRLSIVRARGNLYPDRRGISSPYSLAQAILAIGRVSIGDELQITIIGGADAGWLAAVAEYIFDLRIALFDSDGELVHGTSVDQRPQVQIHFAKPSDDFETKSVAISGQVYKLRDITELFSITNHVLGSSLACSRVPWISALSLTFGQDFNRLLDRSRVTGSAIAAAGRVFKSIAESENEAEIKRQFNCKTYFKDSFGRSFCRFAVRLLPELMPLMAVVEDTNFESLQEALTLYESSVAHIKEACKCGICQRGAEKDTFEDRFCLVRLLETIIILVHLMTGVCVSDTLLPMRSGIEALYLRQVHLHRNKDFPLCLQRFGPIGAILNSEREDSTFVPRLIDTARLFTGREIQNDAIGQVAISLNGVVVFLNSLLDGALPIDPESAGRCTVVTGHIEMHGRSYTQLQDLNDSDLHGMEYRKRADSGAFFDPLPDLSFLLDGFDRISLVAQEQLSTVRVGLSIHEQHTDPGKARSIIVGPASLNSKILEATGLVRCDGRTCQPDDIPFKSLVETEGVRSIDAQGLCDIYLFAGTDLNRIFAQSFCDVYLFVGSDLSRLVALMRMQDTIPRPLIIMQHNECLSCCVRTARQSVYKTAVIITRRRRPSRKRSIGTLEASRIEAEQD